MDKQYVSSLLVAELDRLISRNFEFLCKDYGATYEVGESSYSDPISELKMRNYRDLDKVFFWWINRFQTKDYVLDIAYGDKEFLIESNIYLFKYKQWFGIWEILTAAQIENPLEASGEYWVLSSDFMKSVIERMSFRMKESWQLISSPEVSLIELIFVQRKQRLESAREEQEQKYFERAYIEASKVFHQKEYKKVIKILAPFREYKNLSTAAKKLIQLAEKYS